MARSLLVAPVADHAAMARTCLGLLRALDRRGVKVAYVKPVAQPRADGRPDQSSELVAAITELRPPEPLSTAELEQLVYSPSRWERRLVGSTIATMTPAVAHHTISPRLRACGLSGRRSR